MENKIGFFEEAPGQRSIARIGFAAIIAAALYIAIYQVMAFGHMDVGSFTAMAGIATTLKVWQKSQEGK